MLDLANGGQLDAAHLEERGHRSDENAQVGDRQAQQVDVHHSLGQWWCDLSFCLHSGEPQLTSLTILIELNAKYVIARNI